MRRPSPPTRTIRTTDSCRRYAIAMGGMEREMATSEGRSAAPVPPDVETGTLPAVSWLVSSERFSDHPGSPWYGAWYVAETLNILTKNPGGLEQDDLHPDLRRERWLLRPCAAVRGAGSGESGVG